MDADMIGISATDSEDELELCSLPGTHEGLRRDREGRSREVRESSRRH